MKRLILIPLDWFRSYFALYFNGAEFSTFRTSGVPLINIGLGGKCIIGMNFKMNNREIANPIGRFNRCSIIVGNKGRLLVGKNVGMSSTAIVCNDKIEIGDNVKIGGNVVIYDTDFHSLNHIHRFSSKVDSERTNTAPVEIGPNVFIGAHSTILKGVSIGENSIIGACSLVSRSVPPNEIWAGNPARFLRKITDAVINED